MSVLIPCDGCGTEYVLPSGLGVRRVTGSVVTLRCRQCGGRITAEGLELVLDYAPEQPTLRPAQPTLRPAQPASAAKHEAPLLESLAAAMMDRNHDSAAPPSSASYEPVSSVEVFDSAPPTLHTRTTAGNESLKETKSAAEVATAEPELVTTPAADHSVSSRESETERPSDEPTTPNHELGKSPDTGDDSFSVMPARARSLPAVPRGPADFTGALAPDDGGGSEEIEPLPPSSGSPALAALTRRLDAEDAKTQQSGPDSMTTRLLGMSVSPAFVFGSTAPPVALDANGLAKSQVSETDTEPPPAQREPAKPAARSKPATRSNAAAAWLFGLAALAGIGVATMMQREKLQEAEVAAAGVPPLVQEQRQKDPEPVADPVSNLVLPPPVVSSATDTKNEPQAAAPSAPALPRSGAVTASVAAKQPALAQPKVTPAPKPQPEAKAAQAAPSSAPATQPAAPAVGAEPTLPPIDRDALQASLAAAAQEAAACRQGDDLTGAAPAQITFAPSGRVTSATIQGPPFAGTATGGCIASALRRAKVPPFSGSHVTVSKTIYIR